MEMQQMRYDDEEDDPTLKEALHAKRKRGEGRPLILLQTNPSLLNSKPAPQSARKGKATPSSAS